METAHIDLATLRARLLANGLPDAEIEEIINSASVPVNYSSELRLKEGLDKCSDRKQLLAFLLENAWSSSIHLLTAADTANFSAQEVVDGLIAWATDNRWRSYAGWIYTHRPVIQRLLAAGTNDEMMIAISKHCDEPLFTVITAVFSERPQKEEAVYTVLMYNRGVFPGLKEAKPAPTLHIEDTITIFNLAGQLGVMAAEVLKKIWGMGVSGVTANTSIDFDTAKALANEFGYDVKYAAFKPTDEATP